MATISFAKVNSGAAPAVPVENVPTAPVEEVKPQEQSPAETALAERPPAPVSNSGFYAGDEDDMPIDRGDVRLPRLNLTQGLSDPELKKLGPDGTFVLKRAVALPQPISIVVAGVSRKRYAEKMPKFGEGEPRIFDSLEEVIKAGGTDQWRQSRENKDKDGMPLSRKPWFTPMVTCLLLVKKPEGLAPELEEHFSAVAEDGTQFAACVYTVKSTSFGSFYVPINSEKVAGVLKGGFATHWIELRSQQVNGKQFEPRVKIGAATSEAVRKLAKQVVA